jgi:hypothetical protein
MKKLKLLGKKSSGGAIILEAVWTSSNNFVTVGPKTYLSWT